MYALYQGINVQCLRMASNAYFVVCCSLFVACLVIYILTRFRVISGDIVQFTHTIRHFIVIPQHDPMSHLSCVHTELALNGVN